MLRVVGGEGEEDGEVEEAMMSFEPDVVLSIKHPQLSNQHHATALGLPSVSFFQVGGSGYDHLPGWDPEVVTVCNGAGVLAPFLAESVMGGILALNTNFLHYAEAQKKHEWAPRQFVPLAGQVLLVVGMGAIGKQVAERARAMGMEVWGTRRSVVGEVEVDGVRVFSAGSLMDLLPQADVVSIHVPLTPESEGMWGRECFDAMKESALFVNTSRGKVIDQEALVDVLSEGGIRGAYVDVCDPEPLGVGDGLWDAPGLFLSPHCSDNVVGWEERFAELFVQQVGAWRSGEGGLVNVVYPNV